MHAAGIDDQTPFFDETAEGYDRVMAINLRGVLLPRAGRRTGDDTDGSSIVLFSSVVARSGEGPWAAMR